MSIANFLWAHRAFTASSSSSASMSVKRQSPNTWRSVSGLLPKAGGHSCVIVLTASRRWIYAWFPPSPSRLLYGLLILQHDRRQILWLAVTAHPTAEWIARQLTEAYGWTAAPRYIVRDRDAVCGDIFLRRLQAMGIRDRPTAARSPWQKGICGTADRLDQAGLLGQCRGVGRAASSPHAQVVSELLQRGSHALIAEQDAPVSRPVQAVGADCTINTIGFDFSVGTAR